MKRHWSVIHKNRVGRLCGCFKIDLFHYHYCPLHRLIHYVKRASYFYPKYWFSSDFRKRTKANKELSAILAKEIQAEINREVIKMLGLTTE